MMDLEKPFKTIEVIDSDTTQVCKIACMSCIRGHRTTSCGIPVCRTKIFWTVKRPGRPSNSCTCRFHSSGVCKCVTAIPKCPHKSKKGEKRSNECRCDEQGRFCCLLEPEQWESLIQLQKPTVQFFPNREALEGWQTVQTPAMSINSAATTFFTTTPQRTSSCCGTTTSQSTPRISRSIATTPLDNAVSPQSSTIEPHFSLMDVGTPMSSVHSPSTDVLSWTGQASVASTAYTSAENIQPKEGMQQSSCCGGTQAYTLPVSQEYDQPQYQPPYTETYPSFPGTTPAFDYDRWNQNYQIYQFPNAICQNCGLNGCTCRSCPPLMQNFGTTSWAQSCGRRHARIAPVPVAPVQHAISPPIAQHVTPSPMQYTQPSQIHGQPYQIVQDVQSPIGLQEQTFANIQHTQSVQTPHTQYPQMHNLSIQSLHSPIPAYEDHIMSPEASDPLIYSDFLMNELDRPSHVPDEHMFGG